MQPASPHHFEVIQGLSITQNGSSFVLSQPETGKMLVTNHVGGRIVALLDEERTVSGVVEVLSGEYPEVGAEKLERQVTAFLGEAVRRGIVARTEAPAPASSGLLPVLSNQELGRRDLERADGQDIVIAPDAEKERKFHPDIYWYLTFRCNLACAHCSVDSSPWVDNSNDLDTDGCLRVIDQMAEMNVANAMLSGGEVLIRPDALIILEALKEREIFVGLETNGIRLDRAFVDLALEMQSRNLLGMTISLDGGTAETHERLRGTRSFGKTIRGLRLLAEHGVKFDVQCVLNAHNYHTIPNLYALGSELHPSCEALIWSFLNAAGRGAELIREIGLDYVHIPDIFELIQEHKGEYDGINVIKLPPAMIPPQYLLSVYRGQDVGCSTSCKFPLLGVLPNGNVTICALSRKDDSMLLGNVFDHTLKEIWQKTRLDALRERYVEADGLQGICADCIWKSSCKGSCRAWALKEGDDFYSPYPVCQQAADEGMFPEEYRISRQGQVLGVESSEIAPAQTSL